MSYEKPAKQNQINLRNLKTMTMNSCFITATDTGIGKTTITSALAYALKLAGTDVGIMKPFATGTERKTGYKSEDVDLLAGSAQINDPENLINPYFMPIPLSPYAAAKKLALEIDVQYVLNSFERLKALHDVVLVEGIGGILTPISKNYFVAHLIKDMDLDATIVTGSRIGTVNHTLLTLDAAKKHGLGIRGLIINENSPGGYNVAELKNDLENLSGVPVLCSVPYMKKIHVEKIADILKNSALFVRS
jgi:dethiobiotin synthetase